MIPPSTATDRSSLIFRAFWNVLAAALGLVTIFNQLDRESRRDPDIAGSVPAPFRSFAQTRIVIDRLRSDAPQDALTEAETLVRRRPVPADNLFLLAVAQEASGNIAQSRRTLDIAGSRGWRSVEVQRVLALAALSQNLCDPAAARLLAMWSVNTARGLLAPLTTQLLAADCGPEALGRVLAQSRFVRDTVARQSLAMATPQQYARMIRTAAKAGATFDCSLLRRQAQILAQKGFSLQASAVAGACPAYVAVQSR